MSLANFIVYDSTTGQINTVGSCDSTVVSNQPQTGQSVMLGTADPITQYIVAGAITTRPIFTTASSWNTTTITSNGTSTATLGSSLPNPTVLSITPDVATGVLYTSVSIITGSASITTTGKPGNYTLFFTSFPYQDYIVTITGT